MKPSSVVITKSEVLVQKAGSRYSWWVPLLSALKTAVIEKKYRRIAVVGVPCVVQAVARMRASRHDLVKPYGNAIRLVIGLFCTESFDYAALVTGKLKTEKKIDPAQVKKLDVKGKLEILLTDGTVTSVPMSELEACVRPGCHICTDLTSLMADISAGAVGSAPGSTTLVIRTPAGKNMVENAVQRKMLAVGGDVDVAAIEKLAQVKVKKGKGKKKN
jgi:coenzyme F420 hydrogenase subunit beta